jgi:hypothetical protein
MRTPALAAFALSLVVAGCGDTGQNNQAKPIKIHSEAQEQLHRASGYNRAIGLKRAIYDSGYACKRVTKTGFVGDYKNMDIWKTSCADGRDWAVFIGPDGSAQVRDCKDVAAVGLPECTITKEEASAEPVTAASSNSASDKD